MDEQTDYKWGRVDVVDGLVIRTSASGDVKWSLPVSDVKVVGCLTTSADPVGADYFIVLVSSATWHTIPIDRYVGGCDKVLDVIGQALGTILKPGLANSIQIASQIIHPSSLAGHPVFDVVDAPRPRGIASGLLDRLFPQRRFELTEDVRRALERL